jgi:hypothetical protein
MLKHRGVDPLTQRESARPQFESFALDGARVGKTATNSLIDRLAKRRTRSPHLRLQHLVDVGVQGNRGSHGVIMMREYTDVKMRSGFSGVQRVASVFNRTRPRNLFCLRSTRLNGLRKFLRDDRALRARRVPGYSKSCRAPGLDPGALRCSCPP